MREIVLDTETTGLDPSDGHRLVEIGGIELYNCIPTGQVFHRYIDPQRDMPESAFEVHGLSREFLTGKPLFEHVVEEFLVFVGDAKLVIHNAEFDMRFLNAELQRVGRSMIAFNRAVDTLALARRRHPGLPNSLDALCVRYGIDNSRRTKHGALLDAEILAEVYAELNGGRQAALLLATGDIRVERADIIVVRQRPEPLQPRLSADEASSHARFVEHLGKHALWLSYIADAGETPELRKRA
ncbi:MAG: DNA polymerase III subunit epsilon [Methylobacteriaceae bacterium]|nr:DNA polymerase III subunit epsilon [Methylobacteriaceae bacterium]